MRRELIVLIALVGCSGRSAPAQTEKPAKVAHPAGETEQAVITLTAEAAKRLGIATGTIESTKLPKTRAVPGEVVVPSGGQVALVAPFAARVQAISEKTPIPRAGDVVHRNDPLLRLVPLAPADRDVRVQSTKTVAIAEARLQSAAQKLARLEKLLGEGGASEKQVEEAKADRDAAAAELAAAKKRLQMIDSSPLASDVRVTIEAPHDGVVRLSPVSAGQLVAAGAPVLEIVRSGGFWVKATVYAGDVVREGAPARIASIGAEAGGIDAQPVAAPPSADPATATIDVYYELPKATVRRPGERVRVTLTLDGDEEVRTVPASSVVYDAAGGAWVYEATGPATYARRRVDPVRVAGDRVVVARGPKVGAEVVSTGASELFGIEFGAGH